MLGKEPTVILKVIEEIIRAAIPLALIFGWVHWTEAQTGTVVLFVGVLAVLATRSQVTPDPKVDALIKEAVKSPPHTTVETVKTAVEARE